ncbi:hypothetical protein HY503_01290 [Candidatus Woesebacteria bacterium]|nr:hypothetical protein [Candidatus Woesebacteria bacterium]
MIGSIAVTLAGIVLFLFLFWRRLKEDYPSNQIFTTAFYVLGGILLGYAVSLKVSPASWFWIELAGIILGFALGILRYKLRFFEVLEALLLGLLPWLGFIYLRDSIENSSLHSFLAFFATACLITLFAFLSSHYKHFAWYKSGRIGFSGLATLGTFFLVRAAFASFFPFVISFIGKYEAILSGAAAFIFFLATFNLARST